MEGVLARVAVVHHQLDDLALLQDEAVRVAAVDEGVVRRLAGREGCVQCWDLGGLVCDVVEEGAGISSAFELDGLGVIE